MCYTKPGPRCAGHAAEQVATASRKYQRSVEKVQAAQAKVEALEEKGVTGDRMEKAKTALFEAQVKMYEAKGILRHRRRQYDMTPEGREKLAQRALAFYRAGRMREWESVNRTIDKYRAEYETRLRDFHEIYGSDPDKAKRGRPTPDKPHPGGTFEPRVGWENFEQSENEMWLEVNKVNARLEAEMARGESDYNTTPHTHAWLAATGAVDSDWDSNRFDRAILAGRRSYEMAEGTAK